MAERGKPTRAASAGGRASGSKRPVGAAAGGMKRLQSAASQRRYSQAVREKGKTIGLVPTMGAFHEGHLSLIRKARSQCDAVVVSVFVNPLQFGPGEDFERYPRELARDIDSSRELGVDVVFVPEVSEMYPAGHATKISVGPMAHKLCGAARPDHFDGVCTVVMKLIGIVQPHRIYLGEKDRQQLVILRRMVTELNVDVKVVSCVTVREADGLAMSSRNAYLTPDERSVAPRLYAALRAAQREILVGGRRDPQALKARMSEQMLMDGAPFEMEYIAVVDPETLEDRQVLSGRVLIALAARLGRARLIDNLLINVPGGRMAEGITAKRG